MSIHDLPLHPRLIHLNHIGMGISVIGNLMPGLVQLFYSFRMISNPTATEKESPFHIMLAKNFNQLICIIRAGSRVKADGNFFLLRLHTVNWKLPH